VYTVNCPRNANKFDADIATRAPRPAPTEPPDSGSWLTLGRSLLIKTNARTDSTARTANDTRQPKALPNDVDNGTPRTIPVEAPLAATASARPTCARDTSRGAYPITNEKNNACVIPPTVRPTATTANTGAAATNALLAA
jgi:hypothetical protein